MRCLMESSSSMEYSLWMNAAWLTFVPEERPETDKDLVGREVVVVFVVAVELVELES